MQLIVTFCALSFMLGTVVAQAEDHVDGCFDLPLPLGTVIYDRNVTYDQDWAILPVGTRATFTCEPGYTLSSSLSRTCLASGDWNGQNPSCLGICPPLSLENGRLGYNRIHGGGKYPVDAKAEYRCHSNYSLNTGRRVDIRFCTASGNWTGQAVTCDLAICPSLSLTNGRINYDKYPGNEHYPENTVANFSCGFDYSLSGPLSRTCQESGNWNGNTVTCLGICPPISLANGVVESYDRSPGGGLYPPNTRVSITCNSGFYGPSDVRCLEAASWHLNKDLPPRCDQERCSALNLPNGRVTYHTSAVGGKYLVNTRATFFCSSGYSLSDTYSRTCLPSGNWNDTFPTCIGSCPPLVITNGRIDYKNKSLGGGKYPSGFRADIICNPGFILYSGNDSVCTVSGTWDITPRCGRRCPSLNLEDGSVSYNKLKREDGKYPWRTTATLTCKPGYKIKSGPTERICYLSGKWNGRNTICQINHCPNYPNGSGVTYRVSYSQTTSVGSAIGSTATFTCKSGYTGIGARTRTCLTNGKWSTESGSCQIASCLVLSNPGHGRVRYSRNQDASGRYPLGTQATYSCNTGWFRKGTKVRTCQTTTAQWDGQTPECSIVTLKSVAFSIEYGASLFPRAQTPKGKYTEFCLQPVKKYQIWSSLLLNSE